MSGLLPRTPSGGQTGDFENLNVQTLTVSVAGFVNALTVNSMDVGNLNIASLTTGTINGNPNLNIVATAATVGGDDIVTRTATQTITNKTLTAPIISTISNTGTLTLPTTTTTLVGRNTTDTLTNKTLTSPTIDTPNITNGGTLTLPTGPGTLVSRASSDTLTNKNFSTGTCFFTDTATPTKRIAFDTVSALANTTTTFRTMQAVDQVITFPSATDTVVNLGSNQTLTNKTLTSPTINSPVLTNSGNTITLPTTTTTLVGTNTTDSLTNKDFTNGVSQFTGKVITSRGTATTTDGSTVTLVTIPTISNTAANLTINMNAFCTAGANANTTCGQRLVLKLQNVAGTVTVSTINNANQNAFASGLGGAVSGTNVLVQVAGIASNTINWSAVCETSYM